MAHRRPRTLTDEDRILWNMVAETITPLAGRKRAASGETQAREEESATAAPVTAGASPLPPPPKKVGTGPGPGTIDRPTRTKIARGRLPLQARVDLHGLSQAQAHPLLLSFLQRAQRAGLRHVLVITGKGTSPGSEGALKRAVPEWLRTASFRLLVSAHEDAARRHGGEGALYLKLRRTEKAQP